MEVIAPTPSSEELSKAIGRAVRRYAHVEASQARLLQVILESDRNAATAIFYTVQNVRARNELFGTLLNQRTGARFEKFWNSCASQIQKLASFRNSVVHWHPTTLIQVGWPGQPGSSQNILTNPMPGRSGRRLVRDVGPFTLDCDYITSALDQFTSHLEVIIAQPEQPSPEKFLLPIPDRSQARPQPPQKPKAQ